MTLYYELSAFARGTCGIGAMLLLLGAMLLTAAVYRAGMGKAMQRLALALMFSGLFLLQGITDVSNQLEYHRPFSFFAETIGYLPGWAVYTLLAALALAEGAVFLAFLHRDKNVLTPWAIKESMDALSDGICFYDMNGQPLLTNRQMNRISGEFFGQEILNGELFFSRLKNRDLREKEKIYRTEPSVIAGTKDGRVWEFQMRIVRVKGHAVRELIACDITTQYALSRQLQERNERLGKINERLRIYSQEIGRITAEKEILNAKMQVHNDLGRALLAFRAYLAQPPERRDRQELIFLWRYTIAVLKKETEPRPTGSDFGALLKAAEAIGVKIRCSGSLPKDEETRQAITAALHECLTNTVKHAGGDTLFVHINETDEEITAKITNNGKAPQEEIRETGGLKNLRQKVEGAGGIMTIESTPRFVLGLEFPKGEEMEWIK